MKTYFDHEKLDVYQEAIAFCGWVGELLGQISAKAAAKDQLDRALNSLPLNLAEGNGKFSAVDRARFLEIARGSALECAACLDVLTVRRLIPENSGRAHKGAARSNREHADGDAKEVFRASSISARERRSLRGQ